MRRSISRDSASAARRTSVKLQRGWMRTLMCMPREPLVFGQPVRPTSPSSAFTASATWRMSSHGTPGVGSRSMRSSSGCSRSPERTGWGWSSMQPRLTTQARPAASSMTISSRRAARGEGEGDGAHPRRPAGRCPLLVEGRALRPVDEALEHERPVAHAVERRLGHREIVGDEVALAELRGAGEVRLVRVRDAHLAPVDGQHVRVVVAGHGGTPTGICRVRLKRAGPPPGSRRAQRSHSRA